VQFVQSNPWPTVAALTAFFFLAIWIPVMRRWPLT
jgi:hypothetical protein